jgi:hypothetical protein
MKINYRSKNFAESSLSIIEQANEIFESYVSQGYTLTLRQLYYQFVSRDLLPNLQKSYKRLGNIISDARVAGLIDWDHMEDRTRNLQSVSHWSSPESIIYSCATGYHIDKWEGQTYRPEVWIEKDALSGIIEGPCNQNDVPFFPIKGYNSQSEMHDGAMRLKSWIEGGQTPIILHLGDHDPSGIDMTRDIIDRMALFIGHEIEVRRLGLNIEQVRQYNPPPNFAKLSDARSEGYIAQFGNESWELDALEPRVMADLVTDTIKELRDDDVWEERVRKEEDHKRLLNLVSDQWDEVSAFLEGDAHLDEDE